MKNCCILYQGNLLFGILFYFKEFETSYWEKLKSEYEIQLLDNMYRKELGFRCITYSSNKNKIAACNVIDSCLFIIDLDDKSIKKIRWKIIKSPSSICFSKNSKFSQISISKYMF